MTISRSGGSVNPARAPSRGESGPDAVARHEADVPARRAPPPVRRGSPTGRSADRAVATPIGLSASLGPPRTIAWAVVGTASYALCQAGILVLLTKVGSAALVGRLSFAFAVVAPVVLVFSVQLRGLLTTDPDARRRLSGYVWLRVVGNVVTLGTVATVGWAFDLDAALMHVILIVAVAKSVEATSDLLFGFLQRYDRHDVCAWSLIGKGVASLAAVGIAAHRWGTAAAVAGSLAVVWSAFLVVDVGQVRALLGRLGPARGGRRDAPVWRAIAELVRLAWPLSVVSGLSSLQGSVPRFFIQRHLTDHDQGVFAGMFYTMQAASVLVSAMGQAMSPALARHHVRGETGSARRLVRANVLSASAFGVVTVLVAASLGSPVLEWLYGRRQPDDLAVLVLTFAAGAVSFPASVLGYALLAVRSIAVQGPLFVAVSLVTTLTCAVGVPRWGLVGAPAGLLAGFAVQLVSSALVVRGALARRARAGAGTEWAS